MQVHLKTLGCRLNEAELETWAQEFQKAGHSITLEQDRANLIVINSCAVTQGAVRKSRQLIRRIHRNNPEAKLIVSGCYVTLNPDEAAEMLGVDLVISNKDKDKLVPLSLSTINSVDMPAMSTEPSEFSLFKRGRQRAFIKVQDGCRYKCTFCIVTVARGQESSRPVAAIIEEINNLHDEGIQEVILTGVHLGGYGSDINSHLSALITQILEQTRIPRVRLGSLEPWDLPADFFTLFKNTRLMPHLHLPLQSGCNTVLQRMARRCKTEEFAQIITRAREQIEHFNISTDIIVGFPGETEHEWQQSYQFIKSMGFAHIHIFSYSPRNGTHAAKLPHAVPTSIKKERSQALHQLAKEMKQKNYQQHLGKTFPVLWESQHQLTEQGTVQVSGYTPNYLRVTTEIEPFTTIENKIINCHLGRAQDDHITVTLTH